MENKILANILTASIGSLKKEGKFARQLLWKYARMEVVSEVYSQVQSFISKIVRIAAVGLLLSFFQENTTIEWFKTHWVLMLSVFVAYSVCSRLIHVMMSASTDRGRSLLGLHLAELIWKKNESVGIGTRIGSPFMQKLRTARRCNYYDIKNVGLWPIEAGSAVFSSVVLLGAIAFLNWRIGAIFLMTAVIISFVGTYVSRWLREKEKTLQEAEDMSNEYGPASRSLDSTFLGISRMLFERAAELKYQLIEKRIQFVRKGLFVTSVVRFVIGCCYRLAVVAR